MKVKTASWHLAKFELKKSSKCRKICQSGSSGCSGETLKGQENHEHNERHLMYDICCLCGGITLVIIRSSQSLDVIDAVVRRVFVVSNRISKCGRTFVSLPPLSLAENINISKCFSIFIYLCLSLTICYLLPLLFISRSLFDWLLNSVCVCLYFHSMFCRSDGIGNTIETKRKQY